MSKIQTINIANRVYNTTPNSYKMLNDYLVRIRKQFANELETSQDIEIRISELLDELIQNDKNKVLKTSEIKRIISKIGEPDKLIDEKPGSFKLSALLKTILKVFMILSGLTILTILSIIIISYLSSIHFTKKQKESLYAKASEHYFPKEIGSFSPQIIMSYKDTDYYVYSTGETQVKGKNDLDIEIIADIKDQSTAQYMNNDKKISISIIRYKDKSEGKNGSQIISKYIDNIGDGFEEQKLIITNLSTWFILRQENVNIEDEKNAQVIIMSDDVPVSITISFDKNFTIREIKEFVKQYLEIITDSNTTYIDKENILTASQLITIQIESTQTQLEDQFNENKDELMDQFKEDVDKMKELFEENTDKMNEDFNQNFKDMEEEFDSKWNEVQ